MSDSDKPLCANDFFTVTLNARSTSADDGVAFSLVAFWYATKRRVSPEVAGQLAAKAPVTVLCESFDDKDLGKAIDPDKTLVKEFLDFTRSYEFGAFMLSHTQIALYADLSSSWKGFHNKIWADLGKALKKSEWWTQNKNALLKERNALRKVAEVMKA